MQEINHDDDDDEEYQRVTISARKILNLTRDDLARSRAHVGNRWRLHRIGTILRQSERPVNLVVCGGSISLGHGIAPHTARYSDQLETWMNEMYPLSLSTSSRHRVYNMGSHGADMCAMAKRMNVIQFPDPTDMFILEFAVNDYQGQDHVIHIDHKTDVFFDGFRRLALCAEAVVYKLLADHPHAAVVFLEFQTAILNRKTAQLLHMGVAQHYQIPVISYADALFPDYYRLIETLAPYNYSVPDTMDIDHIQPFPHGCAPCQLEHISTQFREKGCKSLCVFMQRSGIAARHLETCDVRGRPCYVPFFAHDAVHPSVIGHRIAKDLIVEAIASAGAFSSRHHRRNPWSRHLLPQHSGWLVPGPQYHQTLRAITDFVLVQDTMDVFARLDPLQSYNHTAGFELKGDQFAERIGWIATNAKGGESITFQVDLPVEDCYVVYISVLKSYENVGKFTVLVEDELKMTKTDPKTVDCLWEPRISIPSDIQLTQDDPTLPGCTGRCKIIVTTLPIIKKRQLNKVKIVSLSARICSIS